MWLKRLCQAIGASVTAIGSYATYNAFVSNSRISGYMEHDNQQINGWVSRTSADGRTRQTFEYNSAGDFGPSTSGSSPHIPGSIIPPPGGELSNDLRIPGTTVPRLDDDTSVSSVLEAFDFGPVFNFLIMLFLLLLLTYCFPFVQL